MSVSVPPFVVKALFETFDIRRFPFGVDDILAPPDTPRVTLDSAASASASSAVATDDEPPKAVVTVTAPAPAPAPTTNSFRRLCALLRASFHLSPSEGICVRYEDSEGDMVEIASEMECVEAIRQKAATPKQTLKVFVTRRRSPASSPTVPPNSSADAKASAASMPPLSLSDRPSSAASSASPSSIDAAHKQVDRPVAPVPPVALYNHSVAPTHIDVSCSICKVQPIVGPRFYCTTCCVDLCSRCEERNEHPDDHVLLKARTALECSPLCSHPCPGNCPVVAAHRAYTERVAAARTEAIEQNIVYDSVLVADLSYPDGHSVAPASEITKTWTLRNAGATAWPEGTFLCHRRGALKPVAAFETPRARAGEAVNVSIPVKTPAAMGVARGTYQLFDPIRAEFFGAPVWVDVNITKAAKLAAAAAAAAAMADADSGDQPDGSMATWNDAEDDAALAIITAEKEAARSRAGASPVPSVASIVVSAAAPAPAPAASPSPIAEVKSSASASGESKGDAKTPALSRQLSAPSPSASSSSSAACVKPELRNALSLAPYLSAASRAELAAQARGAVDAKSKQKPSRAAARNSGPFADEVNRLRDMGFKSDDDELLGWMMAATDLKNRDVDLVQWVAHKLLKLEANL